MNPTTPAFYELAHLVPDQDPSSGGRRRLYQVYLWLLYDALLSAYGSARRVEVELTHPLVWVHLRELICHRFPEDVDRWLPKTPMRRHHYLYVRSRRLTDPGILAAVGVNSLDLHRHLGCSSDPPDPCAVA